MNLTNTVTAPAIAREYFTNAAADLARAFWGIAPMQSQYDPLMQRVKLTFKATDHKTSRIIKLGASLITVELYTYRGFARHRQITAANYDKGLAATQQVFWQNRELISPHEQAQTSALILALWELAQRDPTLTQQAFRGNQP